MVLVSIANFPNGDPTSALPTLHLVVCFWISQELGGVRLYQDGDGREQATELHNSISETYGWRRRDYIHILYSLWFELVIWEYKNGV